MFIYWKFSFSVPIFCNNSKFHYYLELCFRGPRFRIMFKGYRRIGEVLVKGPYCLHLQGHAVFLSYLTLKMEKRSFSHLAEDLCTLVYLARSVNHCTCGHIFTWKVSSYWPPGFYLHFCDCHLCFLLTRQAVFTGSHFWRTSGSNVGSHRDRVAAALELPQPSVCFTLFNCLLFKDQKCPFCYHKVLQYLQSSMVWK